MEVLMELGFSEQQAKAALEMHGDVELAASYLFSLAPAELAALQPRTGRLEESGEGEECKMVLCVRQDLGMGVGKMCSQCAHAAVMLCDELEVTGSDAAKFAKWKGHWQRHGSAKIVLQVASEAELRSIAAAGHQAGLPTAIVADAGRTEVARGSETVVGIGPAPRSLVDTVTGKLRLL